MRNKVILVIKMPKLPRLIAEKILMLNAQKITGYTYNQLVYGTVKLTDSEITMFNTQLNVSSESLTG